VLVCLIKIPMGLLINSMAAFGLTKMRFRFERPFMIFFLLGMMLPIHVALVPLTILLNQTGLLDTLWAVIIPYVGFYVPFSVFLLRGYFRTLPAALDDAARIDGCSNFTRYWRIILPLSIPVLSTLVIFDFLGSWNEFLMALLFLRSEIHRTVPLGLVNFRDRYTAKYGLMAAGVLISALPVTIVYLVFQKYFISGLTTGSVKG
jgi:raffinose/stachyose/melibiose transport system permease protein